MAQRVVVREAERIPDLDPRLSLIPNDNPDGSILNISEKVRNGEYQVAEILIDGDYVGLTVYCIDQITPQYREFVSIATHIDKGHKRARYEIESFLINKARSLKCQSLRMHTIRAALIKETIERGWEMVEVTLRKKV